MYNYKMTLAYDGSDFAGWQIQPNGLAIQQILQEKLQILLKVETPVIGSGRTDAGVHARGQTANFIVFEKLDLFRFHHALNGLLPETIRILSIEQVDQKFHARYSATGKIYSYHLQIGQIKDPFNRNYTWHLPYKTFSLEKLKEGAAKIIGQHDFKGFASESHKGVAAYDSVRTVRGFSIKEDSHLILEIEADGFLYKMVRNIVGTLVEIGNGRLPLEVIDQIFEHKNRKKAGQAAPAHALFLEKVLY